MRDTTKLSNKAGKLFGLFQPTNLSYNQRYQFYDGLCAQVIPSRPFGLISDTGVTDPLQD